MCKFGGLLACSTLLCWVGLSCSWDYLVWPKSKHSSTPLFRFTIDKDQKAGYINRQGQIVIPPVFEVFGNYPNDDFFDGVANVEIAREQWFVDTTGKKLFRATAYNHFSEGLDPHRRGGKYGYVNLGGKFMIPPTYDIAREFSEG